MATQLPNTSDKDVMRMAVAWHIVEASGFPGRTYAGPDDRCDAMAAAFVRTLETLRAAPSADQTGSVRPGPYSS